MDASDYTYEEPSQEELDMLVEKLWSRALDMTSPDFANDKDYLTAQTNYLNYSIKELNSLTLKQVMGLIPEKRPIPYSPTGHTEFQYKERVGFNQAIDQMTQSAERIWKV